MKVKFKVHGVQKGNIPVKATIDGREQSVLTNGYDVELVHASGRSLTLPLYGEDAGEVEKVFKPDSEVTFTVEGGAY